MFGKKEKKGLSGCYEESSRARKYESECESDMKRDWERKYEAGYHRSPPSDDEYDCPSPGDDDDRDLRDVAQIRPRATTASSRKRLFEIMIDLGALIPRLLDPYELERSNKDLELDQEICDKVDAARNHPRFNDIKFCGDHYCRCRDDEGGDTFQEMFSRLQKAMESLEDDDDKYTRHGKIGAIKLLAENIHCARLYKQKFRGWNRIDSYR